MNTKPIPVAVLCVARKSVYKSIPGVDAFDIVRDARSFPGGMRVLAHPPCRLWSAYCSHQAKCSNPESEKGLGIFCVDQVRKWGGVIEQPGHSRLFDACKLPKPGWATNVHKDGFSIEVPQFWFGDQREKNTWLWFRGILPCDLPRMPFRLKGQGGDRRVWQLMSSKNERERTPLEFAQWLIECARKCGTPDSSLPPGPAGA
jgi:hypothetical protein